VRVAVHDAGIETDELEEVLDRGVLLGSGQVCMDSERLAQCLSDSHPGIERCKRILEDDLHLAAQSAEAAPVGCHDVDGLDSAVIGRTPHDDLTRCGIDQPEGAASRCRFATARFTDESERRAEADIEGDASNGRYLASFGAENAAPDFERLDEVPYGDRKLVCAGGVVDPLGHCLHFHSSLGWHRGLDHDHANRGVSVGQDIIFSVAGRNRCV